MSLSRQEQLCQLQEYIKEVDKEVTLILQSLRWDKETLLKSEPMLTCKYDTNHRIPLRKHSEHEGKCYLKSQGYVEGDIFLPDPLDPDANTLVKFTPDQINQIIENASENDPMFKRGNRSVESQPLTAGRLAATYTSDERRAIHDAVVNTMPSFHDLSDLALPSSSTGTEAKRKSRQEVLAELRDMKRRRTKYRVSGATSNYSHTLRDLIAAQMELYTGSNCGKLEQSLHQTNNLKHKDENTHTSDYGTYNRIDEHNNFKDREIKPEIYRDKERNIKEEKTEKTSRYFNQHERRESYPKGRDRRYDNHDERKKDRNNSYSLERSSSSKDRKRHHDRNDKDRYNDRSKYKNDRSENKDDYTHRRYDSYEKQEKHTSRERSRRKDYK